MKKKWNLCTEPFLCLTKLWKIMRLSVFFLFVMAAHMWAADSYSQVTRLSLEMKDSRVIDVLGEIEGKTEFYFLFNQKLVDVERKVNMEVRNQKIEEILSSLFSGTNVNFLVINRQIVLTTALTENSTFQQQKLITGQVTDVNGNPLMGVTVAVQGTAMGAITNLAGEFRLSLPETAQTIVFSFVGMKTLEVPLGDRIIFNIVMEDETIGIDEVVVVGYGTQKKRDVIGSISTIKADDIMKTSASSFDAALQGMAPGLQVTTSSGIPGAPVSVLVRGIGSISLSSSPLWIIDGIPVFAGSTGSSYNGETSQNIFSMINPADIDNIQVLKDAAATSIYGSRGSNGVIIVTTKSGKQGEARIDVDIKTGVSQWTRPDIGLANSTEYFEIMDMARANSGLSGEYVPQLALDQLDGIVTGMTRAEALATNTNWADMISRTGSFYEASISSRQGTEKGNSYLSLRYRKDYSNLKYNDLETISSNVNLNYNVLKSFTIGYKLYASLTDNNRVKSGDGKGGAGGWAQINSNSLPWMPVYDADGINGFWNPLSSANALAGISPLNIESNLQTINLISGLTGTWQLPVKGLSLQGAFGGNLIGTKGLSYQSAGIRRDGAEAREDKGNSTMINYNTYLNYDNKISENHEINVVTGVENTRSISHSMSMRSSELIGIFRQVGTPGLLTGSSDLGGERYLRGYFGRVNYKFKDKYLLGGSIRRDGISQFAPKNRWATFTSYSAGWILSDEEFFSVDAINMLKIRGSYGQTGNTSVPGGILEDRYGIRAGGTNSLQATPSTQFANFGNSDIKWETTNTLDVGFDYALFNNRVNGSIAYYNQKVEDMLLAVSLPISAGVTSTWENIGDMENKGLDFNLFAILVDKTVKWNVGVNFSTNKNTVLALDPESDNNGVGILIYDESNILRRITKTGYSIGTFYMAEYAGVDVQKGIPMIYEVERLEDGSTVHTGNIIPGTETNINSNLMLLEGKSTLPKILGGFNSNVAFKNLDLNMVWSFAAGHYIYNRTLQSAMTVNRGLLVLSKELLRI